MYAYRKMSPEQREYVVRLRKVRRYPWHGPPHLGRETAYRIVTGACYEHKCLLNTPARLAWFQEELLDGIHNAGIGCAAWSVLPNHYHLLVLLRDVNSFARLLGQVHGRTSRRMNQEDGSPGRKVWYRCQDRFMRSERHFCTTRNYIHHNPVKHGWVDKWQEWPFSSIHWYFEHKGRDWMLNMWREYPLKDYGVKWDVFSGRDGGSGG
ncbi:MAG: transposase [Kiritimatiellaeota bacterium]|nr:transposase [Kiritimatiellota bacterium]